MEQIMLIASLIVLFAIIRKNRKDKLESLYNVIIAPGYNTFFRASKQFILQKDLSSKDKKEVERLKTGITDYAMLLNDAERYKIMFNKKSDFYKLLNNLCEECKKRLGDKSYHFYDDTDEEGPRKKIIYPLYILYKKYNRLNYIIFDWPQI